jgi:hypothetical protein
MVWLVQLVHCLRWGVLVEVGLMFDLILAGLCLGSVVLLRGIVICKGFRSKHRHLL